MFATFEATRALLLGLCICVTCSLAAEPTQTSDDAAIRFLEARVRRDPDDIVGLNLLADRYLERLRVRGDDADLDRAARAVQRSLAVVPAELNASGLLARVRVDQAAHRFARARDAATRLVAAMPNNSPPQLLLGDALLELGEVDAAAAAFAKARAIDGVTVDIATRLARVAIARGQIAQAERHLRDALTRAATQSAAVRAWCHVQLGQFFFAHGRWRDAQAHYKQALVVLPGDQLANERLAELAGAGGDYDAAIAGYRRLIGVSARPEFRQALGDLLTFANRTAEAKRWHDEALAGYLRSVQSGHVHYYHHLAAFFTDSRPDGKAAVTWARKDIALRQSAGAYDAYAWALYVDNQFAAAATASQRALRWGTRDAHLLYHAGMIATRNGDISGGAALLQRAVQANPHYNSFHVHR